MLVLAARRDAVGFFLFEHLDAHTGEQRIDGCTIVDGGRIGALGEAVARPKELARDAAAGA